MIPSTLGSSNPAQVLPTAIRDSILQIEHYAVENVRSARRFLKSIEKSINIDETEFYVLDKRTVLEETKPILDALLSGSDVGVISEAGCPGIADPGSLLVAQAHQHGIPVKPLVGPSSILLAVMASGLNGQSFTFHGYVKKERKDRINQIRSWQRTVRETGYAQVFMDTPFRNEHVLEDLLKTCDRDSVLSIACDITLDTEQIQTKTISDWRNTKIDLHKRPCIFILGAWTV